MHPVHIPLLLTLVLACTLTATDTAQAGETTPRIIGHRLAANLLARQPLAWYLTPEGITARKHFFLFQHPAMHYAEVCAAYGALSHASLTGDRDLLARLVARYEPMRQQGTDVLFTYHPHVDIQVFGILPLEIHRRTQAPGWLETGLVYADRQWENPLPDGLSPQTRWWIDDMYMIGILQVQAFRAAGRQVYADRAAAELAAYVTKLQQPNGLFHHAPTAPHFWSRGNGWVAAGITEVLSVLAPDHPQRAVLLASWRTMMASLLKYQAPEGLWRQIIDREDAWLESSSTAMFGFAFAEGLRNGWLDRATYGPAMDKAWRGLCARLDADGNLSDVCEGTNKSPDIGPYYTRKRITGDFHGQAPFLWFANSLLER